MPAHYFSLKNKIAYPIIIIAFFAGVLASIIIYIYSQAYLLEQKKIDISNSISAQVTSITEIFDQNVQTVESIAKMPEISGYLQNVNNGVIPSTENAAVLEHLNSMMHGNDTLAIYLLDINGEAIVSTDSRFLGVDYSFRDYYLKALTGKTHLQAAVGVTSKEFGYYFSAPVQDAAGQVLGIAVLKVNVKFLENILLNNYILSEGHIMFVDQFGVITFSDLTDRILKSLGPIDDNTLEYLQKNQVYNGQEIIPIQYAQAEQAVLNKQEKSSAQFNDIEDNEEEFITTVKVPDYDFYLVVESSVEKISDFAMTLAAVLGGIIFFIIIVYSLIGYFLIQHFLKPLDAVKEFCEEISRGNFNHPLNIKTRDEIGLFASTLLGMAATVKKNYLELEEKVALRTMELQKFKLAVENASDHIVITDIDGVVLYANKAVEKITGFKQKEVLGKKAAALWRKPMEQKFYQEFWEIIKKRKLVYNGELINRRKNGEEYPAVISVAPVLGEKNEILYFIGIERDVSDQKAAEAQISQVLNNLQVESQKLFEAKAKDEALLENIGDGIIVTDQDGRITLVNKSAEAMLNIKQVACLGKPVINIIKVLDNKNIPLPLQKRPMIIALSTGKQIEVKPKDNYYFERADGSRFAVSAIISPFFWNKRIIGTIEVFRDITEEQNIDRAKTEFVSLASHQLRTPLTAISWYVEMLLNGDLGKLKPAQLENLQEVASSNQRMIQLVNGLLNVSRIELGTFAVEPELLKLPEIINAVIKDLKPLIKSKRQSVKVELPENLPELKLDHNLINIVFQNFLTNAVKYTPARGKIQVTAEKRSQDILFAISDNGYGIPKKDQSQIFTKMFRADNAKLKDTSGTGLGLYLVKSIIEQSAGGKVWFKSQENKGTTFYFTLPLTGMKEKKGSKALI